MKESDGLLEEGLSTATEYVFSCWPGITIGGVALAPIVSSLGVDAL